MCTVVPLNDFIKYYEPAFYSVQEIASQQKRIKRRASGSGRNNIPLKLTIVTTHK